MEADQPELLALPQGDDPRMEWMDIVLRTVGKDPVRFSILGGHSAPSWIHADPQDMDDPYRYQRFEPDMRFTSLSYYLGWWRRGKEWYPDIDSWETAISGIRDFRILDWRIRESYKQRHIRRGKEFISLATRSMESASEHLEAFKLDHRHHVEFSRTSKEPYAKWFKSRYGVDLDVDKIKDRPIPSLQVPEHTGFKQLAIFYDKMDQCDDAIDVCREALAIGWPGDWETRITRYSKRIERIGKISSTASTVKQKRSIAKFCTQCGNELDPKDVYCGGCGWRRK